VKTAKEYNEMKNVITRRGTLPLVAGMVAAVVLAGCGPTQTTGNGAKETVYERVMRTKKIRAAWLTYPPAAMKDTVSGKMTGTFVEALEMVAKNLGLEIQWMDGETPWGNQIEGLNADRYDIVGSPVWANYTRGSLTTLSEPLYYSGIGIYVRRNDSRFQADWASLTASQRNKLLNDPQIRIATIDGETGDLIARTQFPAAKRVSLPQNAEISQLLLNVSGEKADVSFVEPYFVYEYLKSNPGSLKNIAEKAPIQVLGNCYMMKANEWQLRQMLDTGIETLQNSGVIESLLEKYEKAPGQFYRVALPYRSIGDAVQPTTGR
jgi:ABC-type amino acid transport substrate-binding protein